MEEVGARWATLDVETTGLSPTRRVVELAIVVSTPCGRIVDRYETTVNPRQSVGSSVMIHGLRDEDLGDSPRFDEIATEVLRRLEDTFVIAHNLPFDWSTLTREFGRSGVRLPGVSGWCTSKIASKAMGRRSVASNVRLSDACEHFGIANRSPHTAAGDAEATHQLFEVVKSLVQLPPARRMTRSSDVLRLPVSARPLPRSEIRTPDRGARGVDHDVH